MHTFDWNLLAQGRYHDALLSGFGLSLELLLLAPALSLPLACGVAILRMSPWATARWLGSAYVESVRNVPLLAHMLFWYFGAPELLPSSLKEALYSLDVEFASAVIALVVYTAAYMAEDIRSGIRGIAIGQVEAGRSLGLSFLKTMRLVILPQSLRHITPPLISQVLNLWKNTSIAMAIGVGEMMFQAAHVQSSTFKGFEPYAFATAAYIAVSLLITAMADLYERRFPVQGR
jgi:polar amino acid transport system permease protein